jgi:hypothetical protein
MLAVMWNVFSDPQAGRPITPSFPPIATDLLHHGDGRKGPKAEVEAAIVAAVVSS